MTQLFLMVAQQADRAAVVVTFGHAAHAFIVAPQDDAVAFSSRYLCP